MCSVVGRPAQPERTGGSGPCLAATAEHGPIRIDVQDLSGGLRTAGYVAPNHDVRSLEANDERSQSTRALPSGSRNIACLPLSDSVGGNSKKTPLATSSS